MGGIVNFSKDFWMVKSWVQDVPNVVILGYQLELIVGI
jgi:hypothetical protein